MSDQASIASGQTKPRFGQLSAVLVTVLLVLGIVTLGLGLTYAGRTTSMSPLWSIAPICAKAGGASSNHASTNSAKLTSAVEFSFPLIWSRRL